MDLVREVTSKFSLLEGQLQTKLFVCTVCLVILCSDGGTTDGPGEGGDQQVLPARGSTAVHDFYMYEWLILCSDGGTTNGPGEGGDQ
jgi:hypothetical protein